ncbi:hypothetical protein [Sorangium sp. So ce1182]|uniref:hypothetical protein n=1 Tax=Sorangium sp. So ce1182 TaxID=3133334 RepID=UPI003F6089C2
MEIVLEAVEPHLHPLLMPPDSLARVKDVARALPIDAVDFFGFECRLGDGGGPTDCAVNLTREGAEMLAGRGAATPPRELTGGTWESIRRFYEAWGDTGQPPYADARATWLEFDSASRGVSPNLLFGYWQSRPQRGRTLGWLLDTILPTLLGGSISPALRQNLLRCFHACPPGTDDFQIGLMLSRALQAVRLCVFDVPPGEVPPFLERLGWQGPLQEARTCLDGLAPHADFVGLHLDIGERIYPHLDIEPNFVAGPWARQPHLEPRWHEQLGELVAWGACSPAKRDALLSWVGHQKHPLGPQDGRAVLLRGLSHLKVSLRPGARPAAKAYFGIAHRAPDGGAAGDET